MTKDRSITLSRRSQREGSVSIHVLFDCKLFSCNSVSPSRKPLSIVQTNLPFFFLSRVDSTCISTRLLSSLVYFMLRCLLSVCILPTRTHAHMHAHSCVKLLLVHMFSSLYLYPCMKCTTDKPRCTSNQPAHPLPSYPP